MAKALRMTQERDPKEAHWDAVAGYHEHVKPLGTLVLVAVFKRELIGSKTAGGMILPDKVLGEDNYQGRVGLVLSVGPTAFTEDESHKWGGRIPEVGDWIVYNIGNTSAFDLGSHRCRFVHDVNIEAITTTPDAIR